MVRAIQASPQCIIAIAPEGTRTRVERFKTGFLQIARGAEVPVVCVVFDNAHRRVRIGPPLTIGDDIEAERQRFEAFFAPYPRRR